MDINIIEPKAVHDFYDGVLEGQGIKSYKKMFSQIREIYKDAGELSPDTLMYTVYSMEEIDKEGPGELYWGLTILEPVLVAGECNMTRGHFHQDKDCAEFYIGLGGEGLLLLMDETGKTWAERIFPNSVHHISGKLAHRLVNTGDEQLKVGACWPASAGHDYETIERRGFSCRVMKEDGKITFV